MRPFGGPARELVRLALVALAYWLAARLSLNLALVHGQVTPIWPPTGIALVAFLLIGRRAWPAVAVAALAVEGGEFVGGHGLGGIRDTRYGIRKSKAPACAG